MTQFSASLSALPGRNLGILAALILIASPVRGFRPVRAARLPTAKVPKPTSDTEPPFLSVVRMAPMVDSSARVAAALEISAFFAMCSISSVLFTRAPCRKIVDQWRRTLRPPRDAAAGGGDRKRGRQ